jgi:hypothetical protein
MNVDLDFSIVSRFFRGILKELHQKRLWPVAALLLAALVVVPVLLSKSSSPTPVAQAPAPTPPPAPGTTLPTLNVQSTPAPSRLHGPAHDPFSTGSSVTSATTTASTAVTVATSTATATSTAPTATSGTSGANSGTATLTPTSTPTSSGVSSKPAPITPASKPSVAPVGLTASQSYDVSLAITDSSGGVNTLDPLMRLSVLPSLNQPLLVELGVSQGGKRVLFAVQRGAVVSGPGRCTPGPIDCEILSLAPNQTESLSTQSPTGVARVALFAVSRIKAVDHSSPSAATKARRMSSAAGRALLTRSGLSAVSLFRYEPSLGAVTDLRNLTVVGG